MCDTHVAQRNETPRTHHDTLHVRWLASSTTLCICRDRSRVVTLPIITWRNATSADATWEVRSHHNAHNSGTLWSRPQSVGALQAAGKRWKIAPHPRSIANRNHLSCMAFPYADCDNRTDMRIGRPGPGSVCMHTCKTARNASRHEHHTASQTGAPNSEHEHGSSRHMRLPTSARAFVHDQRLSQHHTPCRARVTARRHNTRQMARRMDKYTTKHDQE